MNSVIFTEYTHNTVFFYYLLFKRFIYITKETTMNEVLCLLMSEHFTSHEL